VQTRAAAILKSGMSFQGLRVLSFESRRSTEIATLIRSQLGEPFVAPSMREAPLEHNEHVFDFAARLFAGEFDMMILLTGVGTRALAKLIATRYDASRFPEALRGLTVVARGPKPSAALREMGLAPNILVPEPNTWRELLKATEGRPETRIAVQEYGRSNHELLDALRARGADVTSVRIYQWAMPEDTKPLREAARRLAAGEMHVAMFTTAIQIPHLLRIAAEEGIEAEVLDQLRSRTVVASIGPSCSEMLDEHGIPTDIAPSHPKMGFLVKETAAQAPELLRRKRG
jgi:uroporphyrinogen-III synthase